ncbi:MAG: radical SAM protein [Bacteroidia bacterium]|nr:radical SAM protein [Bacteroidia bacterium]
MLSIRKRLGLEIARRMRKELTKAHPLRQLFWECTLRCNLHCKHCGSDCKKTAHTADMPAEDFLKVIDSITPQVDSHQVSIILTGGEPLMRNDLEQIGRALYDREYPWGMVSNGMFLSRQRLDGLLAAGIHAITISLDGFEEEHNWLRGHPESFKRATEAIRMIAQEPQLKWDVVTCVNQKNLPHLERFKSFLYELGVRHWRIFTIFPVGRAAEHPEFQLDSNEFTAVFEFIKRTRKEGKITLSYGCEGFLGEYEGEVRDQFFSCNAGITVGSILADGAISACPSIRSNLHQGNIYRDDFMEVWNHRFEPFRNREWMRTGACRSCTLFRYCEGNGMHLRDENGQLLFCHYHRIKGE